MRVFEVVVRSMVEGEAKKSTGQHGSSTFMRVARGPLPVDSCHHTGALVEHRGSLGEGLAVGSRRNWVVVVCLFKFVSN